MDWTTHEVSMVCPIIVLSSVNVPAICLALQMPCFHQQSRRLGLRRRPPGGELRRALHERRALRRRESFLDRLLVARDTVSSSVSRTAALAAFSPGFSLPPGMLQVPGKSRSFALRSKRTVPEGLRRRMPAAAIMELIDSGCLR
jgi:hypothetical protein